MDTQKQNHKFIFFSYYTECPTLVKVFKHGLVRKTFKLVYTPNITLTLLESHGLRMKTSG